MFGYQRSFKLHTCVALRSPSAIQVLQHTWFWSHKLVTCRNVHAVRKGYRNALQQQSSRRRMSLQPPSTFTATVSSIGWLGTKYSAWASNLFFLWQYKDKEMFSSEDSAKGQYNVQHYDAYLGISSASVSMLPTKFIFHRRFKHCSTWRKENSFHLKTSVLRCERLGLRTVTISTTVNGEFSFCLKLSTWESGLWLLLPPSPL